MSLDKSWGTGQPGRIGHALIVPLPFLPAAGAPSASASLLCSLVVMVTYSPPKVTLGSTAGLTSVARRLAYWGAAQKAQDVIMPMGGQTLSLVHLQAPQGTFIWSCE